MAKLNLITREQEQKLIGAMEESIKQANAGMDINEAIAKQASDNGFTPEFTARIVEAYNTSKTIKHLQSNSGEKRAETFPLADVNEVLKKLYKEPENVKKATVLQHVSVDKLIDRMHSSNNRMSTVELEKVAKHLTKVATDTLTGLPENIVNRVRGTLRNVDWARGELEREASFAKEAALGAMHNFADSFKYMDDNTDFEEIERRVCSRWGAIGKKAMDMAWKFRDFEADGEKRASEMPRGPLPMGSSRRMSAAANMMEAFEKAGEAAVKLLEFNKKANAVEDYVNEQLGGLGLQKHAGKGKTGKGYTQEKGKITGFPPQQQVTPEQQDIINSFSKGRVGTNPSPEMLNAEMLYKHAPQFAAQTGLSEGSLFTPAGTRNLGTLDTIALKNDLASHLKAQGLEGADINAALSNIFVQDPEYIAPGERRKMQREDTMEAIRNIREAEKGYADVIERTMGPGSTMYKMIGDVVSDEPAEAPSVITPQHESELRKVRMQLMVNDMLSNDPVISAYAPEDVLSVVNQLAEEVPALSTSPLLMRGMVARVLQQGGHLDPAEVEQLLKTEKVKRETAIKGY